MASKGGMSWGRILAVGGALVGAYILWRIVSSKVAGSNLPAEVVANPSAYDISSDHISGKTWATQGHSWWRTGTGWSPTFMGLLWGPGGTKESAERMYAQLANYPKADSASYAKYMPVIRKLIDKGDYKNAEVYAEWLMTKAK